MDYKALVLILIGWFFIIISITPFIADVIKYKKLGKLYYKIRRLLNGIHVKAISYTGLAFVNKIKIDNEDYVYHGFYLMLSAFFIYALNKIFLSIISSGFYENGITFDGEFIKWSEIESFYWKDDKYSSRTELCLKLNRCTSKLESDNENIAIYVNKKKKERIQNTLYSKDVYKIEVVNNMP